MQVYDIFRSFVTNVGLVTLLFTLARPKASKAVIFTVMAVAVTFDLILNIYFYLRSDYSTLALWDIIFFIAIGIAIKPLFQEKLGQWLFNCFITLNIYAIVVILSYYMCGFLPYPNYANTIIRAILFAITIVLFYNYLRPLYRQASKEWNVFLFASVVMFANFAWYFICCDNVVQMLQDNAVPLLLLIAEALFVYFAMFFSLHITLRDAALREDSLKLQSDRELIKHRLSLMDKAVAQMSITQHDTRHFNRTLLSLLESGETDDAIALLRQQDAAFPQKPRRFCENVSVNAAIAYYAEIASHHGIKCDIRCCIPAKLTVDDLGLAMSVSNLLENAVTAVSKLSLEQREIHFIALCTGQLIIEVCNPYEGKIAFSDSGIPLSASIGHGKGSQSVADFVERCGGELVYDTAGGLFRVRMLL